MFLKENYEFMVLIVDVSQSQDATKSRWSMIDVVVVGVPKRISWSQRSFWEILHGTCWHHPGDMWSLLVRKWGLQNMMWRNARSEGVAVVSCFFVGISIFCHLAPRRLFDTFWNHTHTYCLFRLLHLRSWSRRCVRAINGKNRWGASPVIFLDVLSWIWLDILQREVHTL